MSEYNDGGLAERGGGGVASPGGPNTAGGGGGQANRSGMGLGVNTGNGWARNPYSNAFNNPNGAYRPGQIAQSPIQRPVSVRRNPVTGQLEPILTAPQPPYGMPTGQWAVDDWASHPGFWSGNWGAYGDKDQSRNYQNGVGNVNGVENPGGYTGGGPGPGGLPGGIGDDGGLAGGLMAMNMMAPGGGQPGQRPGGPMVSPGPMGPGGQPMGNGVNPRQAQMLAFHQALRDWKGQRPEGGDEAAMLAWRGLRPDRPDWGRPNQMQRPDRPMHPDRPQITPPQPHLRRFIEERMAQRASRQPRGVRA